jgi:4-hydroxythreonine-4-phosphate dehydrogenase
MTPTRAEREPLAPPAPLAVTMGEPAGIGGEIALKAWLAARAEQLPPFFLLDQPERLRGLAATLGLTAPVEAVASPEEARAVFTRALPVLPLSASLEGWRLGAPSSRTAAAVLEAIDRAVALVRAGEASALVTNPIHKSVLMEAGFAYPGHTEYLGHLSGPGHEAVMMLAGPHLKVVPVTVHIPLAEVPRRLTRGLIEKTARITAEALKRDFGIASPRLAVAGLNPHAGEAGRIGREEIETILPALASLKAEGIVVFGPLPADTLFHPAARETYDAVLCMYHDQALAPLKTLDFDSAVNVTLGLPFVRTSPDHGTALDIAEKGIASPRSLIESLRMAGLMAGLRAVTAA